MAIILKELKINGVLNLPSIRLQFNEQYPVYVMQCPAKTCPSYVRHVVSNALQLLFVGVETTEAEVSNFNNACIHLVYNTKDAHQEGLAADENATTHNDNVPSTSKGLPTKKTTSTCGYRTVAVVRDFRVNGGESVEYTLNDDGIVHRCAWSDFYQEHFTDVDSILPHLRELQPNPVTTTNTTPWRRGNWLQLLSTKLPETSAKELLHQVFELSQQQQNTDLLSQLTTSCLLVLSGLDIIKKSQICKTLQDVRKIFEYLTCYEHTVWFLIPVHGQIRDLLNSAESLDFHNVKTRIQLLTQPLTIKTYAWTNVEHVLQDLLIVSFQLAFGFHCKQTIVYLQQLDRIASRQSFHMALNAQFHHLDNNRNHNNQNYLQRIIDVCNKIGIAAIIEYPAGLCVKPINANLIKSRKVFGTKYELYVDSNTANPRTPVSTRANRDPSHV